MTKFYTQFILMVLFCYSAEAYADTNELIATAGNLIATSSKSSEKAVSGDVLKNSLIQDFNEDGRTIIVGFGDSITRGVGDGIPAGRVSEGPFDAPRGEAGYPQRVESLIKFPISNAGVPGETLAGEGASRFVRLIKSQRPDVIIAMEGANDAITRFDSHEFRRLFQAMINIASALGTRVVIGTIPPSCCAHDGREPITSGYNQVIYSLAATNTLNLFDAHRGFLSTCGGDTNCYLLKLPEGLHPNSDGYDVMGELVTSTLLGFDILNKESATQFEKALGMAPGSLHTKPSS